MEHIAQSQKVVPLRRKPPGEKGSTSPGSDCPDCYGSGWMLIDDRARRCQACEQRKVEEKIKSTIPLRFRECTFESYKPRNFKQTEALDQLSKDPCRPYFIHGAYGSGKTHLLFAQYREAMKVYGLRNCILRTTHELVKELQEAEIDGKFSEINAALHSDHPVIFLFWDDADKLKVTDYKQEILFSLVDRIYKHNEYLTITSNLNLFELQEKLSPAITRRIDDMCKVLEL